MNANIEGMFTLLLIGCVLGAALVAMVTSGKPRETIIVVPEPSSNDGGGIGCGFMALVALGIAALVLLPNL